MIYDQKGGLFPGPLFYIWVLSPHHLSAGGNVTFLQANTCEGTSAQHAGCSVLRQACKTEALLVKGEWEASICQSSCAAEKTAGISVTGGPDGSIRENTVKKIIII